MIREEFGELVKLIGFFFRLFRVNKQPSCLLNNAENIELYLYIEGLLSIRRGLETMTYYRE